MSDVGAEWVSIDGLAEWRGESVATVRRKLPKLYEVGFPRPVLHKWYMPRVRAWAAGEAVSPCPADDPLMRAFDDRR